MSLLKQYQYQNKTIAIYGMGKTGLSSAKILKKLNTRILCWDDNKILREKSKKKYKISKFWLSKTPIDNIVISPGIDINKCKIKNYLKKNLKKIITDLDIFFETNRNVQIISITGTNGKSTTCKIIEKILKTAKRNVKTVGNIGNPILSLNHSKKKCIFIIEVSSYQLQYSRLFRSKHAAILNISPDHLERHINLKNYIKVKTQLFFAQNKLDYSYINLSNKYSKFIKKIFKKKKIKSKLIEIKKSKYNFLLKKIKNKYLKSKGNIENVFFAYEITKRFKIKDQIIIKALNNFIGLPHRQQIVFSNKKLTCVNDSKATSFDASLQSLLSYDKIYWIVGGLPKKDDQFNLKKIKKKIVKAYIIGKNVSFFKEKFAKKIPYTVSRNIKNAVNNIKVDLKLNKNLGSTILLSPAAASFDQFKNFEDRGNYFTKIISNKLRKF